MRMTCVIFYFYLPEYFYYDINSLTSHLIASHQIYSYALPALAPAAGGNEWALTPAPVQPNNQWAAAAPPPPAQPDNGWAMASPQFSQPVQQQPTYDQFGGGGAAPAFAAAPSNPFAPAPVVQQPAPVQNFAPPAPTNDPFAAPSFAQGAPVAAYGQPAPAMAPVASDPFGAPAPHAAMLGSPQKPAAAPMANGSSNPVLTMGSLTTNGLLGNATQPTANAGAGTLADKALQNLMGSIDSFGLTSSAAKPPANNPFDSNNIMSNATLGEIKSIKTTERKSIMNTPAPAGPGALVMAGNQGGNWGGYGGQNPSQYGGMGGSMQAPPPPQYSMSGGYPQQGQQQQPQMGGMQQPMMGQQPQMGMMQGQQPPMQQQQQQGYGAPQYGQQPPMQQNQWGAPSY